MPCDTITNYNGYINSTFTTSTDGNTTEIINIYNFNLELLILNCSNNGVFMNIGSSSLFNLDNTTINSPQLDLFNVNNKEDSIITFDKLWYQHKFYDNYNFYIAPKITNLDIINGDLYETNGNLQTFANGGGIGYHYTFSNYSGSGLGVSHNYNNYISGLIYIVSNESDNANRFNTNSNESKTTTFIGYKNSNIEMIAANSYIQKAKSAIKLDKDLNNYNFRTYYKNKTKYLPDIFGVLDLIKKDPRKSVYSPLYSGGFQFKNIFRNNDYFSWLFGSRDSYEYKQEKKDTIQDIDETMSYEVTYGFKQNDNTEIKISNWFAGNPISKEIDYGGALNFKYYFSKN